jgi:hypothetical protein
VSTSQARHACKGVQEWFSGMKHCGAPLQSVEGHDVPADFGSASCGGRPGRLHLL